MEPKQYYIGIDVGGTSVKEGLFDEDGNLLAKASVPTPPIVDAAGFAAVTEAIDQVVAKAQIPRAFVAGIGLAVPCPIPASGDAKVKANIAINLPELKIAIQEHCPDAVVKYENDANAAALGEYAAGAGKGSQSMVAVTQGTGVGGGAILNGKLYTGFNYAGMEIGHFVIEHGGRLCTCGRRGCFEAYCSATALIKRTRQAMEEDRTSRLWELAGSLEGVNGRTPFDAAAQGDPAAGKVIDEYVDYLGCGVASLVNIFQPEVICIGGGPSAQGETLMAPVRYILNREDYARNNLHRTRLVRAALGNDAGIIGAALLPLFR